MTAQIKKLQAAEKPVARVLVTFVLAAVTARQAVAQTPAAPSAQAQNRRRVVVSIPHRKLALIENGRVKKVYRVAVGAENSPSPSGTFQVKNRLVAPTYYHPGKVIPAGANNPLGTRWIGLSTKGYGIHGTNVESSIGKAASHGCIRMHRKDLEELFTDVQVGDQVEIRAAADPELESIFGGAPTESAAEGIVTASATNAVESNAVSTVAVTSSEPTQQ
ncbi:MAG TPA: L,D-transpeptidase [Terriglobales bacterium]|nr:L,D-transpeptidase [Terriglobales bacterium]